MYVYSQTDIYIYLYFYLFTNADQRIPMNREKTNRDRFSELRPERIFSRASSFYST